MATSYASSSLEVSLDSDSNAIEETCIFSSKDGVSSWKRPFITDREVLERSFSLERKLLICMFNSGTVCTHLASISRNSVR